MVVAGDRGAPSVGTSSTMGIFLTECKEAGGYGRVERGGAGQLAASDLPRSVRTMQRARPGTRVRQSCFSKCRRL